MRKKIITLLLAFALTSSMLLTACGNKESDSGNDNTETETETPADDKQSNDSEESDDVTIEEDAAESETPDVMLTADTEITDEDMQELYASIKESVTTEYLEPNGLSASEFSWPSADSTSWNYFDDLYNASYFCIDLEIPFTEDELSEYEGQYPDNDQKLFDAVLFGILNWMDSKGSYDTGYYSAIWGKLNPFVSTLPSNVTF